eukprot:TRINITY_DN15647_c0_g1_i1.p2 TRINITY_DN15647_c0_g1~~TRINITY_DN15647_c0_g1_i1.p2  ORF type:complete len:104 (+),score=24.58 TRINITY_DN15647_c0_g1_i1:2-313(+)
MRGVAGVVKFWCTRTGHGFIGPVDHRLPRNVYVCKRGLVGGTALTRGWRVHFDIVDAGEPRPEAVNVVALTEAAAVPVDGVNMADRITLTPREEWDAVQHAGL